MAHLLLRAALLICVALGAPGTLVWFGARATKLATHAPCLYGYYARYAWWGPRFFSL